MAKKKLTEQEVRENEFDRDTRKIFLWANKNRDFVRTSYKGLSVFGIRKEVVEGHEEITKRMAIIYNNIDWLIKEVPHIRWALRAQQDTRRGIKPREVY